MLPEGLQFASRFDHVTGSAIREIFKVLTRPNMISFAGGSPSAEALPDRECAEIARQVLLDDGKRILQYGATEGDPPFVESLISYLKEHYGFEATPATVLPTTGSTSCMDLLCKAFINPGDTVLVESPTFLGNMQTLRLYEANLVSIPSDDDGVRIDALEEAAKRHHPKLFYVIPCFQNPSGRTLSLERSQQIAELAAKYCRTVYKAGFSPICPTLYLPPILNDAIPEEHKDGIDMSRNLLRRSHVLVVCGHTVTEAMKNDIAVAQRLGITATTLEGILTVKGQGRK